jgi:hypothetical protein
VGDLVTFQVLVAGFTSPVQAVLPQETQTLRGASRVSTTCCTTNPNRV